MDATPVADEGTRTQVPLTDRVNVEPPIINGMTSTEATWIGVTCLLVYGLLTGLAVATTGLWQLLLAALVATLVSLWYASLVLQKVKRDRPDGYYTHAVQLRLSKVGLSKTRFLRHDGYWSVGRTHEISLSSPLSPPPETPAEPPVSAATANAPHAP